MKFKLFVDMYFAFPLAYLVGLSIFFFFLLFFPNALSAILAYVAGLNPYIPRGQAHASWDDLYYTDLARPPTTAGEEPDHLLCRQIDHDLALPRAEMGLIAAILGCCYCWWASGYPEIRESQGGSDNTELRGCPVVHFAVRAAENFTGSRLETKPCTGSAREPIRSCDSQRIAHY